MSFCRSHEADIHSQAQPALTANVKTLIEAGLWSKWVEAGGNPSTVSELADLSGIDAALLGTYPV